MYANVASGTLIVLGAVIAILGFILAGETVMVVLGLAAFCGGGLRALATRDRTS